MHFVYGASPHHILLHFPIKLLHFPIKFASFPQQIALFPQQFASFAQQIDSFPQHSSSIPQHILCHFAKHRIKVFFCDLFTFLTFLAVPIGDQSDDLRLETQNIQKIKKYFSLKRLLIKN